LKKSNNKTAFFIAWRYLFSKKRHNIINIISIISTLGIMVSTAALILILSVFNGMEQFISGCFNSFNPDIEIKLAEGKSFPVDSFPLYKIRSLEEVESVHEVVSDLTLITYEGRQALVNLKGVSEKYIALNRTDTLLVDGDFTLKKGEYNYTVMGAVTAGTLQINLNSNKMVKVFYPKRTKKNLVNPAEAFNIRYLIPAGVFATYTQYDEEYIFCSIDFIRELMDYEGEATSMEVKLKNGANSNQCQEKIESILGNRYQVQNKYQQEELLFKTMKSEKLIIFFILAFILVVAAFNIIGTLGMLIVEKKSDITVFNSLGANSSLIGKIFVFEGMCISFLGGLAGMLLGSLLCFIQQTFHLVRFGSGEGNYILNYYPVSMEVIDFVIVFFTILIISILSSWIPTRVVKKSLLKNIINH